tara:strand:+ start:16538 stop:17512 length:975 start_codon:yes stop_codon:yes gene_type:complete
MGIKYLNTFIKKICSNSYQKEDIEKYKNKKIVVDASIYLYKFSVGNMLIENFYLLISIFLQYNIIPIFVFDGKPTVEKYDIIQKRKEERQMNKDKYEKLLEFLNDNVLSVKERKKLLNEIEIIKKKIVKVKKEDIMIVKELMTAFGVTFIESDEEADGLCSYLVKTGKADVCMSDDTDMFLYNCPLVIKDLDMVQKTVVEYNTRSVLQEMKLSIDNFIEIMVVTGTDYNVNNNLNLKEVYSSYKKYRKRKDRSECFYDWLEREKKMTVNKEELNNVKKMFVIDNSKYRDIIKNIVFVNKEKNVENIESILSNYEIVYNDSLNSG